MTTTLNSPNSSSPGNSSGNTHHNEVPNPLIVSLGSITVQNIVGMVQTKLNSHNFITWSSLFLPVLKKFKLLGLVNGKDLCPPQFFLDSAGSRVLNVAYEI
ncbi:hypothetical protein ACFX15_009900 [Malus domestica]